MNRPLTDDIANEWFNEDRGEFNDSEEVEEEDVEYDVMNDVDDR